MIQVGLCDVYIFILSTMVDKTNRRTYIITVVFNGCAILRRGSSTRRVVTPRAARYNAAIVRTHTNNNHDV